MAMGTCTNISSQDWSDAPFTTILTNGKGFVQDPATRKPVGAPYVLKVQKGKRYRVRAIQGASSWGFKVKAPQGHGMTVIALDGSNVQATPGKGFVFTPGERVDFILHANQVCAAVAVGGSGGEVGKSRLLGSSAHWRWYPPTPQATPPECLHLILNSRHPVLL